MVIVRLDDVFCAIYVYDGIVKCVIGFFIS